MGIRVVESGGKWFKVVNSESEMPPPTVADRSCVREGTKDAVRRNGMRQGD